MDFDSVLWPQNKFANDMYVRQKFPVTFETQDCLQYFNRSEDKQGFIKYYLDSQLLYYLLCDNVCHKISWHKDEGIVQITQDDNDCPKVTFSISDWKCILSKYCIYLDEDQKNITGIKDVLVKLQALFQAYGMFMKIDFPKDLDF